MRYATGFLLPRVSRIGPAFFRRWVVNSVPWKSLHEVRDIIDVLSNTSIDIFESKKEALAKGDKVLENQIGLGKDIMSILSMPLSPLCIEFVMLTNMLSEGEHDCFSGRGFNSRLTDRTDDVSTHPNHSFIVQLLVSYSLCFEGR